MILREWLQEERGVTTEEAVHFIEVTADICNFLSGHRTRRDQETLVAQCGKWGAMHDRILHGAPASDLLISCVAQPQSVPEFIGTELGSKLCGLWKPKDVQQLLINTVPPSRYARHTRRVTEKDVAIELASARPSEPVGLPVEEKIYRAECSFHQRITEFTQGRPIAGDMIQYLMELNMESSNLARVLVWEASTAAERETLKPLFEMERIVTDQGIDFYRQRLQKIFTDAGMGEKETQISLQQGIEGVRAQLRAGRLH